MGILTGLFTGEAKERRRNVQLQERLSLAAEAISDLTGQLQRLSDRVDELTSEHRKLRGRFYAARGEIEATPRTREESKAAALARIGYIPGRPAPHRE